MYDPYNFKTIDMNSDYSELDEEKLKRQSLLNIKWVKIFSFPDKLNKYINITQFKDGTFCAITSTGKVFTTPSLTSNNPIWTPVDIFNNDPVEDIFYI